MVALDAKMPFPAGSAYRAAAMLVCVWAASGTATGCLKFGSDANAQDAGMAEAEDGGFAIEEGDAGVEEAEPVEGSEDAGAATSVGVPVEGDEGEFPGGDGDEGDGEEGGEPQLCIVDEECHEGEICNWAEPNELGVGMCSAIPSGGEDAGIEGSEGVCTPEADAEFCDRYGKECGSLTREDNCGQERTVASCGSCPGRNTCGGGGTPGKCGCTTETDTELCARNRTECGPLIAMDNCGAAGRSTNCGECKSPETCGGTGIPGVCGCQETNMQMCARFGKDCGELNTWDLCGIKRTFSCGTCSKPATCGGGGAENVCGEEDAGTEGEEDGGVTPTEEGVCKALEVCTADADCAHLGKAHCKEPAPGLGNMCIPYCDDDADCTAVGMGKGKCAEPAPGMDKTCLYSCESEADCTGGTGTVKCEDITGTGEEDGGVTPAVPKMCIWGCTADADCGNGAAGLKFRCAEPAPGAPNMCMQYCQADADCPAVGTLMPKCDTTARTCLYLCDNDSDCGTGMICEKK